ncbi:MAG: IS3 family transposase, partial [Erysipelothrix sp.]|nr:IS3 family transposase [Erysipelothrix sp.]
MHNHIFEETVGITVEEKVKFINDNRDQYSLTLLLEAAKLTKSSYFEFINRRVSNQQKLKSDISGSIMEIWLDSNEVYGARKIAAKLRLVGINVSERTVGNYMKDMGIASVYRRKYRPATRSKSKTEDLINHIKEVQIDRPHHFVATDITYIHTQKDGWVYQITFMDLHTRKVLHFALSRTMDDEFVSSNTELILKKYKNVKVIH